MEPVSRWLLGLGLCVLLNVGCDWLFGRDKTPPTCSITTPVDSAVVNGTVQFQAEASDSVAMDKVEFYVDGGMIGWSVDAPYSVGWNTEGLAEHSWHRLDCIAYDAAGNKGYSDTISVEVAAAGPRSVFHGELTIGANRHRAVGFAAETGDTLSGDLLVLSGARLGVFAWLDAANYSLYRTGQVYSSLYQQGDITQASLRQAVATTDSFYLVFANTTSGTRTCWVRFVLE